jgi:hypothetical protein
MTIKHWGSTVLSTLASLALLAATGAAQAQDAPQTLFTNVHVFDGVKEQRIENANVLAEGNLIKTVSTAPIEADGATVIDGAYADLILVAGNPLEDLDVLADPKGKFDLIMKDGKIYKNAL